MGQKPSTAILERHHHHHHPHRRRPAVSLTWMLRQGDPFVNRCLEQKHAQPAAVNHARAYRNGGVDHHHHQQQQQQQKQQQQQRVVGRSTKQFSFPKETHSSTDGSASQCRDCERRHTKRKKRSKQAPFGYEISDVDLFLTQATIDSPGNIPVVVIYPCILYQTHSGSHQKELQLSPGMVVNAVFKNQQWLYVQTPHGDEGYALGASCIPLGILPLRRSKSTATPCWESTVDLYPRPCAGNMTDAEKHQTRLRGGTKSECGGYRPKTPAYDTVSMRSERTFDKLYLKMAQDDRCTVVSSSYRSVRRRSTMMKRTTLVAVVDDYEGSACANTLSVRRGDVVVLVERDETDVDCEWFYVRDKRGNEGFIPATVAGYGYL